MGNNIYVDKGISHIIFFIIIVIAGFTIGAIVMLIDISPKKFPPAVVSRGRKMAREVNEVTSQNKK